MRSRRKFPASMAARGRASLWLVCAALLLWGCASAAKSNRRVLLFSVDGMRTDYLHMAQQLELPTLQKLINGGVLAKGAQTVWPAVTFPSHTSMITGVYPKTHSVWNNNVFGPLDNNSNHHYFYSDITARTIFDAAIQEGLAVSSVDWPVTVGAPNYPLFPGNDDDPADLDEAKWMYFTTKSKYLAKVFPTPQSMYEYISDENRTALALVFLDEVQPDLFAFHFNDLDHAQHAKGFMSQYAIDTLRQIDGFLGQILAKAAQVGAYDENTTVIVTADHGFLNTTGKQLCPAALFFDMGLIGPDPAHGLPWQVWLDCSTGVCPVFIHPDVPPIVRQRVDEAVQLLRSDPDYGILAVYDSDEIQALGAWPGAYVMLELNTTLQFGDYGDQPGRLQQCCGPIGEHGYNPTLPEMWASFLINGPDVKVGEQIDLVKLIDVGPTVAYIMGLSLPRTDGRVLYEVFDSTRR